MARPWSTNGTREWDELDGPEQAAQQGAPGRALRGAGGARRAWIPRRCSRCRRDGETLGEVMFRGNMVMKGYLKNQGDRRGLRGRLVPFRRSRRQASGRLYPAQGPLQGHHHLRRREHLLDRGRGRALQASGGAGGGGGRQARREMGRDALRLHRAEAGQRARPRTRSSTGAASSSRATKCRATWSSPKSRRPRPARSRNSAARAGESA